MAGTVVLVTGSVGAGKTRCLEILHRRIRRRVRTWGFVSRGSEGRIGPGSPSSQYRLCVLGESQELPWAERAEGSHGFAFHEPSMAAIREKALRALGRGGVDVFVADEIGWLEIRGQGIAATLRDALARCDGVVVASVRKGILEDAIREFGIRDPLVVDLDETDREGAVRRIVDRIETHDAERIGLFAGVAGLVEVGLGSILHAWHVPLKGHVLAGIQNVLFVTFGRLLHGRGLVRISAVSAMLKAFSPAGGRLRPMIYIFLQGGVFAVPASLLGWSFGSALAGSILMGWLTLLLSMGTKVVTFGWSILDAYAKAAGAVGSLVGMPSPAIWHVIAFLMLVKAAVAAVITAVSYDGRLTPGIEKLRRLGARISPIPAARQRTDGRRTLRSAAIGAARDLARPRFLLGFMASALLVFFLLDMSVASILGLVARGLLISYLGLVVIWRIDPASVGRWLLRRGSAGFATSLRSAIAIVAPPSPPPATTTVTPAATPPGAPPSPPREK